MTKTTIRGCECHVHLWNVNTSNNIGKKPKALAVLFHGFLAHGYYPTVRYAAEFLAADGFAVVAVDLPGHGQSEGLRGYLESAEEVIANGAAIVEYATGLFHPSISQSNCNEEMPLFLVGSSMGGSIALSVSQHVKQKTAVVLLAPMLKLNVSGFEYGALRCLSFLLPKAPLIPSSATDDEKQYRDPTKRKECADDTLTISGSKLRTASALACVDITLSLRQQFPKITSPFLLMIADEDVVIKNEGSEELFLESPSKEKTKKHYPALHGLLCEPDPLFQTMKKDILDWMNKQLQEHF